MIIEQRKYARGKNVNLLRLVLLPFLTVTLQLASNTLFRRSALYSQCSSEKTVSLHIIRRLLAKFFLAGRLIYNYRKIPGKHLCKRRKDSNECLLGSRAEKQKGHANMIR